MMTTLHHGFKILGVTAIAAVTLMFVRPDVTDHVKALSPFSAANAQERNGIWQASLGMSAGANAAAATAPTAGDLTGEPESGTRVAAAGANSIAYGTASTAVTAAGVATATTLSAAGNVHAFPGLPHKSTAPAATREQQALVTSWLAKKYRVAGDATDMLVTAAYATARDIKLDPLLILSVMAIESGFNPFAESPVGAQGLMQVMSKIHHEKFQPMGGIKAALNPMANIRVGSLILKDYVTRGGSVEAGLKLYVGAAAFDTDFGYGSKVLAEYRRLKEVATGKKVPVNATIAVAKAKPAQAAPASPTTAAASSSGDASGTATTGAAAAAANANANATVNASPAVIHNPAITRTEPTNGAAEKVAAL